MKRLAYSFATLFTLTAAACTGGERNQDGCPADEACSPLTPYGMHFTGVSLVGVPLLAQPKTTAIGGTQRIDLWVEDQFGDIDPLDLPFAAMTDNGDALHVVSGGPDTVVVSGVGSGADLLRITEPDSDLLYDRYEIGAAGLDHIDAVPGNSETYATGRPVAFAAGNIKLGLALYAANGDRLADDSLTLTVTGPQPTRPDWDTFAFTGIGPGTLTADLTAAGRSAPIELDVVDAIDEVLPLSDSFPDTIVAGNQGEVCFHAASGAAESVLGLQWTFTPGGSITSVPSLFSNCFAAQVNAPGTFSVTASALGVMTTVQFTAVAAAGKPELPALAPTVVAPLVDVRGERARLLDR